MSKPKVLWATPERDVIGNGFGYSFHNRMMLKHTKDLLDLDDNADIVLHIVSADKFVPVVGKVNVLFTMWEFLDVPKVYQDALAKADYVIVPCSFCRDIFAPFCKRKPIVCWEGVDPEQYKFVERKADKKFRFLWVGAPNPRKGYQSILQVVNMAEKYPNLEFYLKTTTKKIGFIETIKATIKNWDNIKMVEGESKIERFIRIIRRIPSPFNAEKVFRYGKHKNVFVDTRKLSSEELIGLYGSANAFLFPTLGEGWGLTLTEAMATGLPCIAPETTGCADYFDDSVGYVIKSEIKDIGAIENYGLDSCRAYVPDTTDMFRQMIRCVNNYDESLAIGRRASDRIRSEYTWVNSGKRLAQILADINKKEAQDADINTSRMLRSSCVCR
jgi:glycosyltransferase involved in cell wall biosynthesis